MAELNIPEEVRAAGFTAFATAIQGGFDGPQIYAQTIAAVAPLIVGAELDRLLNDAFPDGEDSDYHYGCERLLDLVRDRAAELRSEASQ